jgi:hypothetical protein
VTQTLKIVPGTTSTSSRSTAAKLLLCLNIIPSGVPKYSHAPPAEAPLAGPSGTCARSVRAMLNNLSATATRKIKMQCATCAPDATASIPMRAAQVELGAVHGILFSHGRCETLKSAAAPLHTGVCRVATPPPSSKHQCAGPVSVSTVRRSHACSCMILVASALAAGTEYRYRNGQPSTVPS